ncbi:hypothetical protein NW762_011115 [Fusarium torreyae]|uniref:Peptidase A1 domain-containing protein n=1 Tax=Fusarium torreyae TaxID=1237075 RepID=A0A9W8V9F9_9HYPO|nr:hypothetical protein NW762_011115 [Fusarium torreyae]
MANDATRDLVVALKAITYSGADEEQILTSPIHIYIDSTDPSIWLPDHAVDAFESAFGLTLDSSTGLYLVNGSHHTSLLASNAEVAFRLFFKKPDYERGVFNVSQCAWVEGLEEHIVTINSKDEDSDLNTDHSSPGGGGNRGGGGHSAHQPSSNPMTGGTISGIVVSIAAVLAFTALVAYLFYIRRRSSRRDGSRQLGVPTTATNTEKGDSVLELILKTHQELPGRDNQIHQLHSEPKKSGSGDRIRIYELDGLEHGKVVPFPGQISSVSSSCAADGKVE